MTTYEDFERAATSHLRRILRTAVSTMAGMMFSIENLLGTAKTKNEKPTNEDEKKISNAGVKRHSISSAELESCNGEDSDGDSVISGEGMCERSARTFLFLRVTPQRVGCDFVVTWNKYYVCLFSDTSNH